MSKVGKHPHQNINSWETLGITLLCFESSTSSCEWATKSKLLRIWIQRLISLLNPSFEGEKKTSKIDMKRSPSLNGLCTPKDLKEIDGDYGLRSIRQSKETKLMCSVQEMREKASNNKLHGEDFGHWMPKRLRVRRRSWYLWKENEKI